MSLSTATMTDGTPAGLPAGPVPCTKLIPLVGERFYLQCDDPWLLEEGTDAHMYLEAAQLAWKQHPEWMDFLDTDSPIHALKEAERDLYLHHWADYRSASRILDIGCGIGRFTLPFLDQGATVVAVDGDLESLRRLVWHAAGRRGQLDVYWSSFDALPAVEPFDLVIAAEALCYHPNPKPILTNLLANMTQDGHLLLSWEAPYAWAAAEDAPAGGIEAAFDGPGVVHVEGERWLRTHSEETLGQLLEECGLRMISCIPTHYTTDGPLEQCLPDDLSLEQLLAFEERCRTHPVWSPLNRIWTVVAARAH